MTALSLRKAYLEGQSDPVAETEARLRRCHDDRMNALITIDDKGALASARAASERYRNGRSLGIWDGVPFVAKDNIAAKGLPWTDGIEAYRGRIAEEDAEIIAFLKEKGGVLIGKANLHEAALGTTNDNPWFGKCDNPHRHGFTPGGSSGGSGAAVGAGLVPLALGTDTMGSVRVPAAYCGVYGWKPGPGVLSQHGVTPLSLSLDTVGLIAASSADLEAYGASLAGVGPLETTSPPTIGILAEEALASAEPNIRTLYGEAVETLRATDLPMETVSWFDDPSANRRAGLALCITEAYGVHAEGVAACPDGFSEELKGFLTFGRDFPPEKLAGSKMTIERLRKDQPKRWAAVDLVLTPTTPYPAHSFEKAAPDDLANFTAPANLIGLPASSVPYGRSDDGIPLGLQLIGKAGGDRRLLAQTAIVDQILNPANQPVERETS